MVLPTNYLSWTSGSLSDLPHLCFRPTFVQTLLFQWSGETVSMDYLDIYPSLTGLRQEERVRDRPTSSANESRNDHRRCRQSGAPSNSPTFSTTPRKPSLPPFWDRRCHVGVEWSNRSVWLDAKPQSVFLRRDRSNVSLLTTHPRP